VGNRNSYYHVLLLLLFLASAFFSTAKSADSQKKYPSLLWEISHPDLEKSSYLYGTMHVSSKVAFHLGDSFFMAIKSVDKVALESDPSFWLKHMLDSPYLNQTGGLYRMGRYYRDFYRNAFKISETKRKMLQGAMVFNSGIVNGMLYRNSRYNSDFEEDTYLDMYIYQVAKKWGKEIVGLEDFMESNMLVRKSKEPNLDEDKDELRKAYRKIVRQGKRPWDLLEEAYRNGDLDMVDSIQFIMNPSTSHQKFMLHIRNRNMVEQMDSILRKGTSLFAGVGAAHLAGDSGMIEMLRDLGFKLRPMKRLVNENSRTRRNELEKTYVKQNLKLYKSTDGWFQVKLPSPFHEIPENQRYKLYLFPEMDNGTTYSLTRFRTYAALQGEDQSYAIERIDSVLYESIPGKIIKQRKIVRNGYPGYDIINKTRKGNYERALILSTPMEFLVFKVGGTSDYLKDNNNLEEVFSSFQITGNSSNWSSHGHKWNDFTVDLPGTPIQENNPKTQLLVSSDCEFQSIDKNGFYYRLKRSGLHDKYYIEEDTFELSYIADKFQEELKFKETNRTFTQYKGFPTLRTICSDSNEWIHSQYIIKGPHYYQMIARTRDSSVPEHFFNSLKFKVPNYLFPFDQCEDTALHFCVISPVKYAGWNSPKSKKLSEEEKGEDIFAIDQQYRNFSLPLSDERIFVSYERFSRYFYAPSYDSLWNTEINYFTNFKKLALSEKAYGADSSILNCQFTDTNSSRLVRVKFITSGDRIYTLALNSDTLSEMSPFAKTFFNSFQYKDTSFGLPFHSSKADLFFQDLQGEDSLAKLYALKSVESIHFENQHLPQLIKLIENYHHEEFDVESKSALIRTMGELNHPSIEPFFKKVYMRSIDTAQYQMAVLIALARSQSKSGSSRIKEYLDYETPLVSNDEVESFIFELYDSLSLYSNLFPWLLDYTRYPEYKEPILGLLSEMLKRELVKPKKYSSYKKILLREAKDNLKRLMAQQYESEEDYYYGNDDNLSETNSSMMLSLNTILLPYSSDKNIDEYYQRALRVHDDDLMIQTMIQLLKTNCEVNDTLWNHFGNKLETRMNLYNFLEATNRTDKFPDSLLKARPMAEALLYRYFEREQDDSLHFLKRIPARDKNGSGSRDAVGLWPLI